MRRPNPFAFVILWMAVAAAGSAAFPGSQKPYPVVTSVKDGVKGIMNPDFPRDGRFSGKLIEEMTWGTQATPEAALLNKPVDLHVDDQGRVYVLDQGDVQIKVYDAEGKFLRAIGREGIGPGEFMTPAFMALMSDGRICLLDAAQRRVSLLTIDGRYLSGFPLIGFFRGVAVDGRDRIYLAKWESTDEVKRSAEFREIPYVTRIYRTDTKGNEMDHLVDFLGEKTLQRQAGKNFSGRPSPYNVVWGLNRNGRIYGGCNEFYRLGAYGKDGKPEFFFGREYDPIANPRYGGDPGESKSLPAFYRTILFDDEGNLWLERSLAGDKGPPVYDVFSPEGIYLRQITLNRTIKRIKNGKVYASLLSESEDPLIKRFRLELSPEK